LLAPAGFYAQKSIGLRLGTPVLAVLPADHAVVINGGERIAYRKLLIATGGNARNLDVPGAALAGVHRLHTRDDADAVRAAAAGAKRAVVVGGKAAAGAAFSGRGRWFCANHPGLTRAYPPAWFSKGRERRTADWPNMGLNHGDLEERKRTWPWGK
jgi:hypothetical protein